MSGKTGKINKAKEKRAAGIFFTDGKEVLLLKRSEMGDNGNTWSLPGGKIKKGETDFGAATRETKEETGLDNIPGELFDTLVCKSGHHVFVGYLLKINQKFKIDLSEEHTDWGWFSLENLPTMLHPRFRNELPRYLKVVRRKTKSFREWTILTSIIENFQISSVEKVH